MYVLAVGVAVGVGGGGVYVYVCMCVVVMVVCCFLFSEVRFLDMSEDELPRNHLIKDVVIDHERRLGD